MIKQTVEYIIYENGDGSVDAYKRLDGGNLCKMALSLEESIDITKKQAEWMDIFYMVDKSPALREAIERVIVLYELQVSDQDRSIMWHPV